ncbi:TonB-dependent receptor [Sphingomonas sp. BT-65]|uniref:TonB-dependent receptor n=1 Tax=Sphingomonas sp. BT-65 TaxID=2989821 RepID=UPI002235FB47|nr:TonB-dependent receptor [Sphingomonas sp. BT-65]MCW4462474.1 TonB-dependent receptor [Sphingomonas sp. BT-65]
MRRAAWMVTGLIATVAPTAMAAAQQAPASAQEGTPPAPDASGDVGEEIEGEEVVVTGQLRGAVPGDVKPEVILNPADIRAYGASNVGELIEQLAPQLGSGAGRGGEQPVILLSGRRSSLNEVRQLPPEAIERMDILPEEAALRYGYGATQKVINFVLRRRFQAITAEIQGETPTAGGNSGVDAEMSILKLNRDGRVQINVEYDQNSGILESERGVSRSSTSLFDTRGNITGFNGGEIDPALSAAAGTLVTVAGVPDGAAGGPQSLGAFAANANRANVNGPSAYRTLVSPQRELVIGGLVSRTLSPTVRATANVRLEARQSESLLGLPTATLELPTGNPFSPFTTDVQLLRYLDNLGPLTRSDDRKNLQGQFSINGDGSPWSSKWNWSVTGDYNRNWSETHTTRGVDVRGAQALLDAGDPAFNPFAPLPLSALAIRPSDISRSESSRAQVDMLTNGALFRMPAGEVNTSLRVAGSMSDLSSSSLRSGVFRAGDISRDIATARGNISVPIANRNAGVLSALGNLSVTANFEVNHLSDFGRLTASGYGVNWNPINEIRLIANWTFDRSAPEPGQLGDPVITTPNVRTFDYVRGETVDITRITGGNPLLRADRSRVMRLGAQIRPLSDVDLSIDASYTRRRFRDETQNFPGATAETEAAFPERFVRDGSGRLLSIDARPVNYSSSQRSQFSWGINFGVSLPSPAQKRRQAEFAAFREAMAESRRTGEPLPPEMVARADEFRRMGQQSVFGGNQRGRQAEGQRQDQGQRAGEGQGESRGPGPGAGRGGGRFGGPGGGGGRFGGGGGGGGGNRLNLSVRHTWLIEDKAVIRPGLPAIDRLNGETTRPAHLVEARSNLRFDWLRASMIGNWRSASQRTIGPLGSTSRLDYASLATLNLEVGIRPADYRDLGRKHLWLRNTQVELGVVNLFDARQRVTDENGVTPAAFAPNILDPTGRVVRLSIRKQLF